MAPSLEVLTIQAKQAAQVLGTLAGELRQHAGIYGGVVNPRLVSAAGNAHAAHLLATVVADSLAFEARFAEPKPARLTDADRAQAADAAGRN